MENDTNMLFPKAEGKEILYLEKALESLPEDRIKSFAQIYNSERKPSETILILTLLGFIGIAGINRFVLNRIGTGILFLLTGGFCLVGTIIDVINYKKQTLEYNQKVLQETLDIINDN